jgi:hypothetical protein
MTDELRDAYEALVSALDPQNGDASVIEAYRDALLASVAPLTVSRDDLNELSVILMEERYRMDKGGGRPVPQPRWGANVRVSEAIMAALDAPAATPSAGLNDDAGASVWLYGNWREITRQMPNAEREHAADAVARSNARLVAEAEETDEAFHREPAGLRWWLDPSGSSAPAAPRTNTPE